MLTSRSIALIGLLLVTAALVTLPIRQTDGIVMHGNAPIKKATVRWQGECERTITDSRGRFRLRDRLGAHRVTAYASGYRIASAEHGIGRLTLRMQALPDSDNRDYEWIEPHPDPAKPNNCANCHAEIHREWQSSAHAASAVNSKFLSLFDGDGKHPTWNARKEHPDGAAVCAACHVPTLRSASLDYDIREAKADARSGIHCDACHKVTDVPADKLGLLFGRDALEWLRPTAGDAITYGPLDDAVRPGESFAYMPVYRQSRYCGACHEGIVFGVHAYGTYSEWLESPAKKQGKQCQDCHMAPTGTLTNIAPRKGGVERRPETLASHAMPGATAAMLRRAVSMQVATRIEKNDRVLEIEIVANHVGHRVPTGYVDRHLVLVVKAAAADANHVVDLTRGERLPQSAGAWSGLPGRIYAKRLIGEKDRTPTPFWLPVERVDDTRLFPGQPDRRTFAFPASTKRATVELWHRRFWAEVAESRGWRDNDTLIASAIVTWD